jgi:hypothetical protein
VTTRSRVLFGAALVAGLGFLTGAVAAPTLPPGTYKKTAEADIAQLQQHIATCIADPKDARRYGPTAKSMAMMLAMYGEATGDSALKAGALKVAEAIAKKDFNAAAADAKGLKVKPGGKALAPDKLQDKAKYELDEVMSPFRSERVGGLNLEKDMRDFMNGKMPIDPAALEILGTRTAVLADYAAHKPNDKASVNAANKQKWEKWSKDTADLAGKIVAEAAKGKGASEKELIKTLKALDAKCTDCHNEFRD